MKQIQQNLKNGFTEIVDIPIPNFASGEIRIVNSCSLISTGTERMLTDFGKSSIFSKARQQPEKVQQVLQKAKNDGVFETYDAIKSKLNTPIAMGYSCVGVVDSVGCNVKIIKPGMRVVSTGGHAEVVTSPENLVSVIPDKVPNDEAVFTPLSAIALQGIRLVSPQIGEKVAVIGLGLIGLLTVQILQANGCEVIGMDYDVQKLRLAKNFGAQAINLSSEDAVEQAFLFSQGHGVDAVLIATSTSSSAPIDQATAMCRQRGRIVLLGTANLNFKRDSLYKKEITFQVSCSFGPGRYDQNYEEKGLDFPYGLVRWTEHRNFQAVLKLMADKKLNVSDLITHRYDFLCATQAYKLLSNKSKFSIGVLLTYDTSVDLSERHQKTVQIKTDKKTNGVKLGFIGAGAYASRTLIPAFRKTDTILQTISSFKGTSAVHLAKKYGIQSATTDVSEQINSEVDALVISTRHDSHSKLVLAGLRSGKHIFVEKPLCVTKHELASIRKQIKKKPYGPILMVGFNRRFAPLVGQMKCLLEKARGPLSFTYTINAGQISSDHWAQDEEIGGGRIIGEVCHFIDLARYIVGHPIIDLQCHKMQDKKSDTACISLAFDDGSCGTINFFSNGHRKVVKERLEVFCHGKILQLDNFRKLRGFGWKNFTSSSLIRQNKGQIQCAEEFVSSIKNGKSSPIPIEELLEVTECSINAAQA